MEGLQIKHSHNLPIQQSHIKCANACFTCCRHTNTQTVNLQMSPTFQPKKKKHPSIKLQIRHDFFSSHHLAQSGTNIQACTYHADSDRTPSPGWARFPFSGSSHPLFVVPSCAWDCSHVDVDRTVASTSGRGYDLPFLLPLLPVSLLRGGFVKELRGAVNQR